MWPTCLSAASVTLDFSLRTTHVNLDRIYGLHICDGSICCHIL